jgi:predicted 2-oxoglutarate/Fe(II)-dependent dioxygenase YbiX
MNIEDAIVNINLPLDGKINKHLTNKELFNKLIEFTNFKAVEKMKVGKITISRLDKNVRNVNGYTLTKKKISDKVYFRHINNIMNYCYVFYKAKFPLLKTEYLDQIDLLKYEVGGKYEKHVDHFFGSSRTLSFILNLNEEYEGGDFVFYDQKENEVKKIKCNTGTVIFFPSNFLYPHSVQPITKGTRYSIVGWIT